MKKCSKCKIEKPYLDFHKSKREKDGYKYECKVCRLGHEPHKKPEFEKECRDCKIIKPLDNFRTVTNGLAKWKSSYCKPCLNKRTDKRRQQFLSNDIEIKKEKNKKLKQVYGITAEMYLEMYNHQNGCCKICNKKEQMLNVDHCHKTNKIRGLLCGNCNTGIGQFKDDSRLLMSVIEYLHSTNTDNFILSFDNLETIS